MNNNIELDVALDVKLGGKYRLMVHSGDEDGNPIPGTERVLGDWSPNLVTDFGLNFLGATGYGPSSVPAYCRIGTGSATPSPSDVALQAQAAVSPVQNSQSSAGTGSGYGYSRWTFTFAQGAVVGNMTEIGISFGSAVNSLFSRALITDGAGTPISVTVIATDILTVVYELDAYYWLTDDVRTIVIGGVSTTVTTRLAASFSDVFTRWIQSGSLLQWYNGLGMYCYGAGVVLGAAGSNPTGGGPVLSISNANLSLAAYSNGTFTRTGSYTLSIAQGNAAGGLGAVRIEGCLYGMQTLFNPVVPKDNTKTLQLTWTITWGRYP